MGVGSMRLGAPVADRASGRKQNKAAALSFCACPECHSSPALAQKIQKPRCGALAKRSRAVTSPAGQRCSSEISITSTAPLCPWLSHLPLARLTGEWDPEGPERRFRRFWSRIVGRGARWRPASFTTPGSRPNVHAGPVVPSTKQPSRAHQHLAC